MTVDEILEEIAKRCNGLQERIVDMTLDRYVRTELINRRDVLHDLFWWIKDKMDAHN